MRYYIDWLGRLWKGPGCLNTNCNYAYFDGFMHVPPYDPVWIYARSAPPEDAEEVTEDQACNATLLFWPDKIT